MAGLTTVTSGGILDGTIQNADINASAAIDASKVSGLSTDSITEGNTTVEVVDTGSDGHITFDTEGVERMRINSTGNVGIGTDNPVIQTWRPGKVLDVFGGSGNFTGEVHIGAARGDGVQEVGSINFYDSGQDSTHRHIALIEADKKGSTANKRGGALHFYTKPDNVAAPAERMIIDSSGNVGIGTTSPGCELEVDGVIQTGPWADNDSDVVRISNGGNVGSVIAKGDGTSSAIAFGVYNGGWSGADDCVAKINGNGSASFDGNVGIGTTSPNCELHVGNSSGNPSIEISRGAVGAEHGYRLFGADGEGNVALKFLPVDDGSVGSETMRIDGSGRLLIGTSSTRTVNFWDTPQVQIEGTNYQESSLSIYNNQNFTYGPVLALGKSRGTSIGSNTVVQDDDYLGTIAFYGSDGSDERRGAEICAFSDGTPGSGDMPGRLVFSTTADGSSSPTERMRIHSDGVIGMAMGNFDDKSVSTNSGNGGVVVAGSGNLQVAVNGATPVHINRMGGNGTLISFHQAGSQQGYIAVSGSTVSYNGGHLARMSQTVETADPAVLLKGTVMTNLNEMCEWRNEDGNLEDNEQLNKMAVSSVEGDPNVAGVMVNIDEDGDLNVAMTGDMIIRIAQGTTVARGDLLMSAGDGTAKPQGDDIVRSKTIAKVTSTTVSTTYDDGSYCVPCVLMAC